MDFKNKVVLITGAGSGIGASAALLFAKQSAKLVLIGRNEANLLKIAEQCRKEKSETITVVADLQNDADVENIVTKSVETFGGIDVLINNAGIGTRGTILDGIEAFDKVMRVNMRAVYLLTSLAAPYLIKRKGNIVNVSSVAAFKPIYDADLTPYCISKAALDQFTRCVAKDLAKYGVRVNSVNPGGVRTEFAVNAGFAKAEVERLFEVRDRTYPLGKMALSEEVADLILYLASDRARSITAGIYVIDNGEMLM